MQGWNEEDMGYFPLLAGQNIMIMARQRGDVTAGYRRDVVTLVGDGKLNGPYTGVQLVVQNGANGTCAMVPIQTEAQCGDLFIGDFLNNRREQIWLTIWERERRIYGLYGAEDNSMTLLFDPLWLAQEEHWEIRYRDHFRVDIDSITYEKAWTVDLSRNSMRSLADIYNWDGKLRAETFGTIGKEWIIQPIRTRPGGAWRLLASRPVWGISGKLGYMQMILGWHGDDMRAETVDLIVVGRER